MEKLAGKTLLKEYSVETKGNNKKFSIYYGDILEDQSDVIGIPVYDQEENKGDIYKGFQECLATKESYSMERRMLVDEEIGWTGVSVTEGLNRHIVFIHSTKREGEAIQREYLHSIIRMTFSSLTSYIYEGQKIYSVALPVLFRKCIAFSDYVQFIHFFIYESIRFLQKNKEVQTLNLYIWHEEDVSNWMNVLQEKLELSIDKKVTRQNIVDMKKGILSILNQPVFLDVLPIWLQKNARNILRKANADPKEIALLGDKLVNRIVDELCKHPMLPIEWKEMKPFKRIIEMKSQRLLIEWFADYLLSIKLYRNYTEQHLPTHVEEYHYFMQLRQVLERCADILLKKNKWIGNETHEEK